MKQYRWLMALVVGAFLFTGVAFGQGNAESICAAEGTFDYAYKIDGWDKTNMTGEYTDTFTGVVFSIKDYKPASKTFDWSATAMINAVIVKGGPDGSETYIYNPPVDKATGLNTSGGYDVSNVTFCWNAPKYDPLVVEKTAEGSYDRVVRWKIEKRVDDDEHSGLAGQLAGSSVWEIVITKSESLENYLVTGDIKITNSNDISVDFSVVDKLTDGTDAVVTCATYTVPANGSITCTYTAKPKGGTATANTATVTSLTEGVGGGSDTEPFEYEETLVGFDEAVLTDSRFPLFPFDIVTGSALVTLDEDFLCSSNASLYVNGRLETPELNVATLTFEIGSIFDDATVVVICELPKLEVKKTAEGSFDRTVEWKLEKTVDPASHKGYAGELAGSSTWTVVATKSEELGNYKVEGTITITNPASVAQTFYVTDVLSGDSEDEIGTLVKCGTYALDPGAHVVCTYEVAIKDATLNTATVTADGNPPVVATATVSYDENLIGYDEGTLTDRRFGFQRLIDDTTTVTFPERFACSADASLYTNGVYEYTETNTATLNRYLNLEASATVTVACYLEQLDVSKTVDTSFNREHFWKIAKSVETENGYELDDFAKIWLYINGDGDETATWTVDVTYDGFKDSDFNVSGFITIENTGFDAVITDVVDLLGGTEIDVDCGVEFPYTLPAGTSPLRCSYSEDGYVEGNNVVTVTTERDTYSARERIVWGKPTKEINDTITVVDDSDLFGEVELGTVTAPNNEKFTYTKDFAWADYGADGCGSFAYLNTATIVETEQFASATLKVNVQCFVYETAYAKGDDAKCFIPDFARWGWTNPIMPGGPYEMDLWAAAAQCNTGKGTLVGTVTVDYGADGYVTVTYNVGAPYMLDETHVYAGVDMYPKRGRRSTVAPGQYTNASPFNGGQVYVIAHAVVGLPDPGFGPSLP